MNTAACNCHTQTAKASLNERPRYYARQLVTPDDMTLEQDYFRARLRRHNRYLHGWGVVCGAEVVEATKAWKVIVKAGFVLGPYGDEIFIESDQCVDVRKRCVPPESPDDEECLEAQPAPADVDTEDQWLAIRYLEKKTRLVKVPLGGCGCEDSSCEHTRFQDHYEICVIDHCPESHQNPPGRSSLGGGPGNSSEAPDCPECQEEPWVVLSGFTVDEAGKVTLSQCDCRRQVLAFGDFWWACSVQPAATRQPADQPSGGTGRTDTPVTPPPIGTTPPTPTPGPAGVATPAPVNTATPVTPAPRARNESVVAIASGASKRASKTAVKKEKSETPNT
jgi:hypothetical protein